MSVPLAIPAAIQPAVMPVPDPKYLRPSIDPRTAESHQVFRQACASGDLARVTSLVIAETRNAEYLTQGLLAAIYQQRIQIVEYLLNTGAGINRAIPNAAASAKSLAIFRLLVEHGWDVNDTVMGGETILPSILGDETLVKWFLDNGARPNLGPQMFNPQADSAPTTNSGTCLNVAASKSSAVVFDMLLNHGAKRENSIPLHMAAGAGVNGERIPMMAHLVELGFDVNGSDEVRGPYAIGTPLQYAIRAGSVEKVKFLLKKGADAHKPIGLAGSPFKMAERSASEGLVGLLRNYC